MRYYHFCYRLSPNANKRFESILSDRNKFCYFTCNILKLITQIKFQDRIVNNFENRIKFIKLMQTIYLYLLSKDNFISRISFYSSNIFLHTMSADTSHSESVELVEIGGYTCAFSFSYNLTVDGSSSKFFNSHLSSILI